MKTKKKGYGLMMALTVLFSFSTIMTLIPQASASKECFLGYFAHCSFTPISTILMALLVALTCRIRKNKYTEETAE